MEEQIAEFESQIHETKVAGTEQKQLEEENFTTENCKLKILSDERKKRTFINKLTTVVKVAVRTTL